VQLESVTIDYLIKATKAMPDGIDHVVWPEYAVPYDIRRHSRDWNLLLDLCREKDITLTFGTQTRSAGQEKWFNIAITMDASGVPGEHTKVHTVHMFDDSTPGGSAATITALILLGVFYNKFAETIKAPLHDERREKIIRNDDESMPK
jgi:hypothetical protein